MIIFRRIVAVLLSFLFIFLLTSGILLNRVNHTVGDADFVSKQLRDADVYNWMYNDLAPAGIKEAQKQNDSIELDLTTISPDLIAIMRALLPPDWVQQQTEGVLHATIPYFTGREDHFEIKVPVRQRLIDSIPAVKQALQSPNIANAVYNDVVTQRVDETIAGQDIPFGLTFTSAEVVQAFKRIAPAEFIAGQLANNVETIVPYLSGDKETFTVKVDIASRRNLAADELKALVLKKDLTGFVYDKVIAPEVDKAIGTNYRLPFNLILTTAEMDRITKEALPRDWVQLQVVNLVGATADYAAAKTNSFSIIVPLSDREQAALAAAGALMDQKLTTAYNAARPCTVQEIATLNPATFVNTGIPCRLPGVTIEQIKQQAGITDYQSLVAQQVGNTLPNSFSFTEAGLRAALGIDQAKQLDDIRRYMTTGLTFDQRNLEEAVAEADYVSNGTVPWDRLNASAKAQAVERSENVQDLRKIRQRVKTDISYTDADLRKSIADNGNDPSALDDFETVRSNIGKTSNAIWLILLALVVLVGIGLLGGRRLWSKILWAAAVLFITGFIILIAAKPVWNSNARDRAADEIQKEINASEKTELEKVVLTEVKVIVVNSLDDAGKAIAGQALLMIVVSVAAGAGAIFILRKRDGKLPTLPAGAPAS